MSEILYLNDDDPHEIGNKDCFECMTGYPKRCVCGGLVHAVESYTDDGFGGMCLASFFKCDRCDDHEERGLEMTWENWEEMTANKVYGKMIFTSSPDRGLENLLYCLPWVKEQVPELRLEIFYGFHNWHEMAKNRGDVAGLEKIERLKEAIEAAGEWATLHDRLDQEELAKHWKECYVWGYLDTFTETYCLSAKEAQCAAVPSVTSNVAALQHTVGEYGTLITDHPYSKEGRTRFVEEVIRLHQDKDYWVERSKKAFEGSKGISWDDRYKDYWKKWVVG